MHSSLVTKVEKAHRYARERDRFSVGTMAVTVKGDNDVHTIELSTDGWHCTCDYFLHHSACCHQLALQLGARRHASRGRARIGAVRPAFGE